MAGVLGSTRHAVMARELTKQFETFLDGTLGSLAERLRDDPEQQLGELVLLVEGRVKRDESAAQEAEEERVMAILSDALPLKQAATLAARITGGKRNRLYQLGLRRQESGHRQE
jgi:16S rRNA (cytidine1402-2'-O)-methyltransferase